MDECMHYFNINIHDTNAIVKNLIPNISNKSQIPLIPNGYRRSILKIKHMTWTYDPKPDPKEKSYESTRQIPHFTSAARPSHASLSPKIRLRLKVCESCSSMGIVTHSFSRFDILAFALDGYSTLAGPFDASNFSLPSPIKFWTLFLKFVQSSIE